MICKEKYIMIIILILNCKFYFVESLVYYRSKYYLLNLRFINILGRSFGKIKIKEFLLFKMFKKSYMKSLSMKLIVN